MSAELYRKYLDIINENSQPRLQLDEGLMDKIKSLIPKAMKLLPVQDIASKVKQVTGGDFTPSRENAMKVAQAFGFDKMVKSSPEQQVAEGWAGNWQGKLLQLIHLLGVGAGAAQAIGGSQLTGMQGFGGPGEVLIMVGLILLMVTSTFWSSDRGMVGAMGKNGKTGFNTGE